MPLDAETIKRLTQKKKAAPASKPGTGDETGRRTKRFIRHRGYPSLAPNSFVMRVPDNRSVPCESFGCGAPSYYKFLSHPLCNIHIVYALVYELNRLSGAKASEESGTSLNGSSLALSEVQSNGSGEDDSYL